MLSLLSLKLAILKDSNKAHSPRHTARGVGLDKCDKNVML